MAKRQCSSIAPHPFKLEAPPVCLTVDLAPFVRLINEFLGLRCAPDLLGMGLFPNGKEITESMAAYAAARKILGQNRFGNPDIMVYDVGSGSTPRTAGLFACRSRWQCVAVDPRLKAKAWSERLERVTCITAPIENYHFDHDGTAIITLVHAHVAAMSALRSISADRLIMVAIPCCMDLMLPIRPTLEYQELGCWSPKRTVRVWDLNRRDRAELIERTREPRPAPEPTGEED